MDTSSNPPEQQEVLRQLNKACFEKAQSDLGKKCNGVHVHLDVCSMLREWVGADAEEGQAAAAAVQDYAHKLQCMSTVINSVIVRRPGGAPVRDMIPEPDTDVTVALHQLGFEEDMAIKGASPSTDILDCLEKIILKGNETSLYPLQVLYNINRNAVLGAPVEPFSVGLHVGFAVTLASHIFASFIIKTYGEPAWNTEEFWRSDFQVVASRLSFC